MNRSMICTLPLVLLVGCASPFDERGDAVLKRGELPRWVLDEWEAKALSNPGIASSRHDDRDAESLDELIAWALKNNPSVQAAEARWHAARERIVQAGTLPEPELTYRISVEQIDTNQSPVGHTVGISQMFPWFGTLERAVEVRSAEARAAAQRYVQQQLLVVSAIKAAWAEYVYLGQAAEVFREQIALLKQIEPVVRSRFRTGEVGQRDLVRIEAESDRVENNLRDVEEMIVAAAAQVNAAVGRHVNAPLPQSDDASVMRNSLDIRPIDIDADALLASLARLNPDLERLRHELAARRHAKQLAEKQFYPDIMLGVEYGINTSKRMARMDRGGSDMLMGMIGLRLPIWRDSYEAGVREAMAEWGATLRELDDRQNTLEAELKMAVYAVRDAQRRAELFGDRLRIRAEQVLQSTRTAYRAGEATFSDLIEAQRELLEFELATRRAEADRFKAVARMEEIVGEAVDAVAAADVSGELQETTR
jgi:outer membrane protein, heavy metal efflux system